MGDPSGVVNQNDKISKVEESAVRGEVHRRLLCELLLDFARNSTLHGPRYLTARGLHVIERIFWGVTFVTSVCLCVLAMGNVWVKWQTSPIIITVNEHLTSAMEIPFPAVTICQRTKVNQYKFNYTKHYISFKKYMRELKSNYSGEELKNREQVFMDEDPFACDMVNIYSLACARRDPSLDEYIDRCKDVRHRSVQLMIKAASFKMFNGTWENTSIGRRFLDAFAPVLMKEGICFTFNTLATDEIFHMDRLHTNYSYLYAAVPRRGWSPERGYFSSGPDTYPRRGRYIYGGKWKQRLYGELVVPFVLIVILCKTGQDTDMSMILSEGFGEDYICRGSLSGHQVYFHHPADLPQSSRSYYTVQDSNVVHFSIKVNLVTTSDTLINYAPHIRQCYFPSERTLHFFKMYTQKNCRLECLTNYTLKSCGCVPHYMPRNQSTPMCTSNNELICIDRSLIDYSTADDGFGNINDTRCQCLPLCHSVQYEAEVARTSDDMSYYEVRQRVWNEIYNESNSFTFNKRTYKFDQISMNYKESHFTSLRRSELFGATDFLANCGGLLGLFLGFSFLSLVEIFYFFTLRLGCMCRRQNKTEKKEKANQKYTKNV